MAHYNPNGKVYAFEPGPLNFKNLSRNILENPLSNLYAIEKAIGSEKGFVNFNIPECGAHSTVLRLEPNNQNYANVEIVSLDEWIVENNIGSIDLIKIDVEGFEAEVLKGAANTIFTNKPYVYMEFNSITTIFESRVSPLNFAEALWKVFHVFKVDLSGQLTELSNARDFTYENIMHHGCIDNLMLTLRDGVSRSDILIALDGL